MICLCFTTENRIKEFEELKNIILLKSKKFIQNNKNMKRNSVRCDNCKSDIHRVSCSRHLKSEKHSENISQKNICSQKTGCKRRN